MKKLFYQTCSDKIIACTFAAVLNNTNFFIGLINLIHYKSLLHNKTAYKKYNINKPLIASLSSKDFPDKESRAWLDTGHSKDLVSGKEQFNHFTPDMQQQLLLWSDNGFIILKNFFDDDKTASINKEIEKLVRQKNCIQRTITS